MSKGDQAIETAADKLETFVMDAQSSGGVKGKLGAALAEDPNFLRRLKPSLIVERAKGNAPTDEPAGSPARAPSAPQAAQPGPPKAKRAGGLSAWTVLGGALAAGYALAKAIDWRGGHARPRG